MVRETTQSLAPGPGLSLALAPMSVSLKPTDLRLLRNDAHPPVLPPDLARALPLGPNLAHVLGLMTATPGMTVPDLALPLVQGPVQVTEMVQMLKTKLN